MTIPNTPWPTSEYRKGWQNYTFRYTHPVDRETLIAKMRAAMKNTRFIKPLTLPSKRKVYLMKLLIRLRRLLLPWPIIRQLEEAQEDLVLRLNHRSDRLTSFLNLTTDLREQIAEQARTIRKLKRKLAKARRKDK